MEHYRGLTWDHPRGRIWLEAATPLWRERGIDVQWDLQPLEGFEGSPIDELSKRYDLIVLDHPHLGDALKFDSLQPLENVLGDGNGVLTASFVGPSLESYRINGQTWALPIDAATQVSARDQRIVAEAPSLWEEVAEIAAEVPVALCLAGPHALLSLFSVASALGASPIDEPGRAWLEDGIAAEALQNLRSVHIAGEPGYADLNPISLLERLGSADPLAYVPLIYGYVNYSRPDRAVPVAFGEAPKISADGVLGSTIGGTGVAVSHKTKVTSSLQSYLKWLISPSVQRNVIPEFEGQPALTSAWHDPEVDEAAGHFYSSTIGTIESSIVRPRYAGFPVAQQAGSAIVREYLDGGLTVSEAVRHLHELALASHVRSTKGTS